MKTLAKFLFPIGYRWSIIFYAILGGLIGYLIAGDTITSADIVTGVLLGVFVGTIGGTIFKEVIEHHPHKKV
ncbi:hypothetical protein [Pontibacter ruber]|uniref:Glycine zipper family protein n=1 Tax=Pontibacter ruber TaxID=1343895 RepID=A0ABW5D172_9BACT|nr:hypothetical protein [Pontibacter ruber]